MDMGVYDVGYAQWSAVRAATAQTAAAATTLDVAAKKARTEDKVVFVDSFGGSEHDLLAVAFFRDQLLNSLADGTVVSDVRLFVSLKPDIDLLLVSFVNWTDGSSLSFSELQQLGVEAFATLPSSIPVAGLSTVCLRLWIEKRTLATPVTKAVSSSRDAQIAAARLLVVGAGGIGCELLKNLVMVGFRDIVAIDLDTIDATNLNRQFLFAVEHVGKPKSTTAVQVLKERLACSTALVAESDRGVHLKAMHENIKAAEFDVPFFQQFTAVLNGLDNLSARKHVNRMCMAANVPLIESGTMGFNGQVQPIIKQVTECYDCRPKPADQKTFAVCTIHARPTSSVHCVHYAKELFERLFSRDAAAANEAGAPLTEFEQVASSVDRDAEAALSGVGCIAAVGDNLIQSLFVDHVQTLLEVTGDNWTVRRPTVLCRFSGLRDADIAADALWRELLAPDGAVPTVEQLQVLLCRAVGRLVTRRSSRGGEGFAFSKEDDDAVMFVACIANLRAHCFHIPMEPLESMRSIAGNIVPAIATANAIIAAAVVAQAVRIACDTQMHNASNQHYDFVYLRKNALKRRVKVKGPDGRVHTHHHSLLVHTAPTSLPSRDCSVCADSCGLQQMSVELNVLLHTVGSLVDLLLKKHCALVSPSLSVGSRVLYEDEEFETLRDRPLSAFATVAGEGVSSLTVVASDLHQHLEWNVRLVHTDKLPEQNMFVINGMHTGKELPEGPKIDMPESLDL